MDIKEKYSKFRPYLKNGDIMLIRGNSFISKSIQYFDKSYYNHALLVYDDGERLFAIQAGPSDGVAPAYLSEVIRENTDFCILRPKYEQSVIDKHTSTAMDKSEDGIKYNKMMILQVLLKRKFGWNVKKLGDNSNEDICSMFTGIRYGKLFPLTCFTESAGYKENNFLTPQDLMRCSNPTQISVLFNDFVG